LEFSARLSGGSALRGAVELRERMEGLDHTKKDGCRLLFSRV
jgi:hypothetical protein